MDQPFTTITRLELFCMYFCRYFGHVSLSIFVCPFTPFWSVSSKYPCSHLHIALFVSESIVAYMQSSFVHARFPVCICTYPCLYLHVSPFVSGILCCPPSYSICMYPGLYLLVPSLLLNLQFDARSFPEKYCVLVRSGVHQLAAAYITLSKVTVMGTAVNDSNAVRSGAPEIPFNVMRGIHHETLTKARQ